MLRYSVLLTAVGVATVAINALLARAVSKRRVNISRSATANAGKKYSTGVSGIEMIETIKAAGAENSFFERWSGYQALMNRDVVRTKRLNEYLGSLPALVSSLANITVLVLGYLDTGQAVALLPRGTAGYYYLDPQTREKVKVSAEVAAHIDSRAVFFYRPLPSRPLTTKDVFSFAFSTFSRADYLIVIGVALAVTLIGLLPAWANKIAYGVVAPSGQAGLVLPIAFLLVGVTVTSALIGICRNLIMARVSIKLDIAAESATYGRVLSLPPAFSRATPLASWRAVLRA